MIKTSRHGFLLVLSLLYNGIVYSQINKSGIGINLGAVHDRITDRGLTFNKLLFRGTLPTLQLDYAKQTIKSIFTTSFAVSGGKIKVKNGEADQPELTNIQLSISLVKKIAAYKMFGRGSTLFAGLQLGSLINYIESEGLDNKDLLVSHGLSLNAVQDVRLDESTNICFSIILPAGAFMKRLITDGGLNTPPTADLRHLHLLFSDTRFSIPGIARFTIDYLKKLSPRTDFNISYGFTYINNSLDEPLRLYSNELLLGFKFYFKHEK